MSTTFYKVEPWEVIAKAREDERQECLKIIYDYMDRSQAGLAELQACRELAALIRDRGAVADSNGVGK
jgi:hypothetical protein